MQYEVDFVNIVAVITGIAIMRSNFAIIAFQMEIAIVVIVFIAVTFKFLTISAALRPDSEYSAVGVIAANFPILTPFLLLLTQELRLDVGRLL
ncbi:MAG: hypothetical protein EZS28_015337 [Streblomastix strix]|uniref:Uncharacterized protein n=1 Tax=Streblomastix strix TaxID=222440 RepID=A0A5J4W3J0_9EUKA|nr:MAG: hypothetical protein EZS28_015337 [Streblomastix strix]